MKYSNIASKSSLEWTMDYSIRDSFKVEHELDEVEVTNVHGGETREVNRRVNFF